MKQSELAGKIGVAPSTVSDWLSETKGREPGVSKLYSIATVLGGINGLSNGGKRM